MKAAIAVCVQGREAVLRALPELESVAEAWGQGYEAADLPYLLAKPARLRREPVLMLLRDERGALAGAALLLAYTGIFRGVYATSNRRGRRTIFAPWECRVEVAARAARALAERGALLVSIDMELADEDRDVLWQRSEPAAALRLAGLRGAQWALHRGVKQFDMPLERDYDATLARLGKRTRRNLRYYERLCMRDLGCVYEPEVAIGLDELRALNAECSYAVSEEELRWRMQQPVNPVLAGLRDSAGRWVSLLGGRRNGGAVEIDWQMNRRGLEKYSLTTAMRSLLIRDEGARGSTSLLAEGGTVHSMADSFRSRPVYNLAVRRPSPWLRALGWALARFYAGKTITLAVHKPWRVWRRCSFPAETGE